MPSTDISGAYVPTAEPAEPIALPSYTPSNAAAVPIALDGSGPVSTLPADMPSTFVPAFVELTDGGQSLSTLTANAADAAAGRVVAGTVGGELKHYQVRVGDDAQVLPGIVRPANFDAEENPVVFVSI